MLDLGERLVQSSTAVLTHTWFPGPASCIIKEFHCILNISQWNDATAHLLAGKGNHVCKWPPCSMVHASNTMASFFYGSLQYHFKIIQTIAQGHKAVSAQDRKAVSLQTEAYAYVILLNYSVVNWFCMLSPQMTLQPGEEWFWTLYAKLSSSSSLRTRSPLGR